MRYAQPTFNKGGLAIICGNAYRQNDVEHSKCGDATADNLATVFSVEGCRRLGEGFAADALTADFATPTDGKAKVRITPKDENADSFFARVGLNPPLVDGADKPMK